jgi:hypothetical protein
MPVYEVRPRKNKRGVDLISDALPFAHVCYGERMQSAMQSFAAGSHDAVIRLSSYLSAAIRSD